MSGDRPASRTSTVEIKSEIQKRLGMKIADQYFMILGKFLSCRMSKSSFGTRCIRLIGRENLSLHNSLIHTILSNAREGGEVSAKSSRAVSSLSVRVDNGYKGSCLQSLYQDGFPVSPRKGRTPRGSKFREKLSPLGPLGKTPNLTSDDSPSKVLELPGATDIHSPGRRQPVGVKYVEDGEEVDQTIEIPSVRSRGPITPPFGVCINGEGSKKLLFNNSLTGISSDTCLKLGELPDNSSLKTRLDAKVKEMGLEVSLDFVNCLNKGVDIFLKSLIAPTVAITRAKSQKTVRKQELYQTVPEANGIRPPRHLSKPIESVTLSTLDFRVAMELNPTALGKDWQTQLEKITLLGPHE